MSNKSAVIIVPPLQDFYSTPHRVSSLGAETVRRILLNEGYSVTFINGLNSDTTGEQLSLPPALSYLKPHLLPNETGKSSFFTRFRHFGKPYQEIIKGIETIDPSLCFISCFAFCYSTPALELAEKLKQRFPRTMIIAGGAGVSVYPEYFLRQSYIDHTLCGEAEGTLSPFLHYIERNRTQPELVPNLGWKEHGALCFSPFSSFSDTNTILPVITPTPGKKGVPGYTTSLSRGCPAKCRFCSNHLTHGISFRHCTIEAFERSLSNLPEDQSNNEIQFNFEDDNLLYDFPFFMSIIGRCRTRFRNIRFFAENGLDYRLLTPDRCTHLIKAGFGRFNFTIGSVLYEVLKPERRTADLSRYDQLLSRAAAADIPVISYLICGLPDDTKYTIAENLRFIRYRKTVVGMSMFYPVPGLAGFEDRSIFSSLPPQLCAGSSAYPWSSSVATGTLVTTFRLARFINLTRLPAATEEERRVINQTLRTQKLHTVIREQRKRRIIEVPGQDEELVKMVLKD